MPTLTPIEAHFQRLDDEKASGQGEKAKDKVQLDEYRQCFDASRGFEDDKDWLPQLSKAAAAADAKAAKAATKTAVNKAQLKKQALDATAQKWSFDTVQAASQAAPHPPPHHSTSPSPPKLAQSKAESAWTAHAAAESRHRYLMRTSLAYRQSLGADCMRDTDSTAPSMRSQPNITSSYPYQDSAFMRQGMDTGRDGLNNRPGDDTQSQASSSYYSAASNGSGNESKRAQAGHYSSTIPAQPIVTVHPQNPNSTGLHTNQYHYPQPEYRQQSPTRPDGSGHAATSALNRNPYAQAGYFQQNPTPAEAATTAAHKFNRNRDQSFQSVYYSAAPQAQRTSSPVKATTDNQSAYNNFYPQTGYYDSADAPFYFNGYNWSGYQS